MMREDHPVDQVQDHEGLLGRGHAFHLVVRLPEACIRHKGLDSTAILLHRLFGLIQDRKGWEVPRHLRVVRGARLVLLG